MSLAIPNTTTQDDYAPATTFPVEQGAGTPFASGYIVIANSGATVSVLRGTGLGSASWGPNFSYAPTALPLNAGLDPTTGKIRDFIFGVRFRSAVAGNPAQVFGGLFQLGDVTLNPGQQFVGTISPSGGFTPPATSNVITGRINNGGGIIAGTGFSIVKGAAGKFTINFTSPFSAVPTVLCSSAFGASTNAVVDITVPMTVSSIGIVTFNTTTGVASDENFNFVAFPTQ